MKQTSRPQLLVLTQVYRPEPNFITADVAEALAQNMSVTVVTAHPNYPLGRFYDGVKWWRITRTEENGVTVWRLPLFPDQSLSKLRRAVSYLSFALLAMLVAPFVARSPDVVWVYHGAFTTALPALWYRWFRRSRIVITCADLWPESFVATGVSRSGLLLRLLFAYSRFINRTAHLIICCTRGTFERCRNDGLSESRLHYVPVWVQGVRAADHQLESGADHRRNIVYAGNLGPAQKLDVLIRAAALLERRGVSVSVDIYGTGSSEAAYRQLATELGAHNIVFHGRVSQQDAFEVVADAFAHFVALQPSPFFRMTVPSKLYVAFAAGTPLLAGLHGEAAELAAESGGAVPFDAEAPESLAAAITELLGRSPEHRADMRRRMQQYYRDRFASSTLLQRYTQLLQPEALVSSVRTTVSAPARSPAP